MNRRIKLRHIEAFLEIARRGQMKSAAGHLALTQPAISRTLKELEDITGVRLFERDRAGAVLTPLGRLFFEFVQSGMSALEQGFAKLEEARTGTSASLAIGVLPSVAARLMPAAIRELQLLSPEVTLTIEDGQHSYLVDRLRSGELDAVLGRLGPPDTMHGIAFTQLYLEHVALVVRPGHPLLEASDLSGISDFPVIYPNRGAAIRPLVDQLLQAAGIAAIPHKIESVSGAFGRNMALSSDAIWIISEGVVANDIETGRLVRINVDTTMTAGPVGLMMRANEAPGPMRQTFMLAVSNAARNGVSA